MTRVGTWGQPITITKFTHLYFDCPSMPPNHRAQRHESTPKFALENLAFNRANGHRPLHHTYGHARIDAHLSIAACELKRTHSADPEAVLVNLINDLACDTYIDTYINTYTLERRERREGDRDRQRGRRGGGGYNTS